MQKFIGLALISMVFLVGCTTNSDTTNADDTQGVSVSDTYPVSMFDLSKTFIEPNLWSFSITADMPTPCHSMTLGNIAIAESFPEQVFIEVVVKEPSSDMVCAQVIDTQKISGEYQASEGASVSLNVKLEE